MFRPSCKSLSRIAVAGLFLACVSPSFALPITLSAGQSAGFNFFMDNEGLPLPYESLRTDLGLSGTDSSDLWKVSWYEDPALQGAEVAAVDSCGSPCAIAKLFSLGNADQAGILDGLFSVQVSVTQGSITLDSLTSIGFVGESSDTGNLLPTPIETTPPDPNRVPEPTAGALVVLALACAGVVSRRRPAAQVILG